MFKKEDFIDGDKFEDIAKKLNIIFTETKNLKHLSSLSYFKNINTNIIMSHNCDGCILAKGRKINPIPGLAKSRDIDFELDNIPSTLKFLFAQNADVRDDRIIPLPIGLERDKWYPELKKKDIIIELSDQVIDKTKLVYLNVNINNNLTVRPGLYTLFQNNNWCTVEQTINGDSFKDFALKIKSHKFILCPDGNGMDTHRIWESLYLGSYPIVQRHYFTEEFSKHVPLLIVDNIRDVNEELLNRKYEEFKNRKWNWRYLKISYWKKLIQEKYDSLKEVI